MQALVHHLNNQYDNDDVSTASAFAQIPKKSHGKSDLSLMQDLCRLHHLAILSGTALLYTCPWLSFTIKKRRISVL
jgi:hypothetical protein